MGDNSDSEDDSSTAGYRGSSTRSTPSDSARNVRATLFCCLSCGIPFSFPDEAYTTGDPNVRSLVLFVHRYVVPLNCKHSAQKPQ